jgi:hypothetical protein
MKRSWLRWLAVLPLVPGVPLLFFAVVWGLGVVQLVAGAVLLGVSAAIWRAGAGRWDAWPFDRA